MAGRGVWQRLAVLALIPSFYLGSLLISHTAPERAQACSLERETPIGGAPSKIELRGGDGEWAVGADAFFLIEVSFLGTDSKAVLDALEVDVRTEAGEVVTGQLELLEDSL